MSEEERFIDKSLDYIIDLKSQNEILLARKNALKRSLERIEYILSIQSHSSETYEKILREVKRVLSNE